MGKRSRTNFDKNGCKCNKLRKAVTLEDKLSVIHFTHFSVTWWFLGTNLSRNTRVCCTMNNKQYNREKLTVAQLLTQFPVIYTTRRFITISTTAWLTPNFFSPPTFCSHTYSYWTAALLVPKCSVHFTHHADTSKWVDNRWDTDK
jgi:hypothetical protein